MRRLARVVRGRPVLRVELDPLCVAGDVARTAVLDWRVEADGAVVQPARHVEPNSVAALAVSLAVSVAIAIAIAIAMCSTSSAYPRPCTCVQLLSAPRGHSPSPVLEQDRVDQREGQGQRRRGAGRG